MPVKTSTVLMVLLILPGAFAVEPEPGNNPAPDLDLLEFLGEWETEDGQWVDPMSLLGDSEDDAAPNGDGTR